MPSPTGRTKHQWVAAAATRDELLECMRARATMTMTADGAADADEPRLCMQMGMRVVRIVSLERK